MCVCLVVIGFVMLCPFSGLVGWLCQLPFLLPGIPSMSNILRIISTRPSAIQACAEPMVPKTCAEPMVKTNDLDSGERNCNLGYPFPPVASHREVSGKEGGACLRQDRWNPPQNN